MYVYLGAMYAFDLKTNSRKIVSTRSSCCALIVIIIFFLLFFVRFPFFVQYTTASSSIIQYPHVLLVYVGAEKHFRSEPIRCA